MHLPKQARSVNRRIHRFHDVPMRKGVGPSSLADLLSQIARHVAYNVAIHN